MTCSFIEARWQTLAEARHHTATIRVADYLATTHDFSVIDARRAVGDVCADLVSEIQTVISDM